MNLELDKSQKNFRRLRKLLGRTPERLSPEEVHELRTQTRRVEAIAHAFLLERKDAGYRLLKSLKPIRRAAGEVRDIDVFVAFTATLEREGEEACFVQLLEHLGTTRTEAADHLRETIHAQHKEASGRLHHCRKLIERNFDLSLNPALPRKQSSASVEAVVLKLSSELGSWPQLNTDNLHRFRLKVKRLRYILELIEGGNQELLSALSDVKDAIGRWHDWSELQSLAEKVLDHQPACRLREQVGRIVEDELSDAIALSNQLRAEHFTVREAGKMGGKSMPAQSEKAGATTYRLLAG